MSRASMSVPLPGLVAAEFDQVDDKWVALAENGDAVAIAEGAPDHRGIHIDDP